MGRESGDGEKARPAAKRELFDKAALAEKIRKKARSLRSKNAAAARQILAGEIEQLENGGQPGSIDKFMSLIYDRQTSLFDYFSAHTLIFVSEHTRVKERMHGYTWQSNEDLKAFLEEGVLCKGLDNFFEGYPDICERLLRHGVVYLDNFTSGSYDTPLAELVNFSVRHLSLWGGSVKLLEEDIESYIRAGYTIVVLAGTDRAARRFKASGQPDGAQEGAGSGSDAGQTCRFRAGTDCPRQRHSPQNGGGKKNGR